MDKRLIGYWLTTGLFCLAMGVGGVQDLLHTEPLKQAMGAIGFPEYVLTILGVAKVLGVVALLIPRKPLLKEWAYAGFTFELLGASASHLFSQHDLSKVLIPLVILAIALVSYWLRPSTRRLQCAMNV